MGRQKEYQKEYLFAFYVIDLLLVAGTDDAINHREANGAMVGGQPKAPPQVVGEDPWRPEEG
ncbi:MAG: hypothetical protein HC914_02475 [Chloroflexaceae bacterium]|nr:hypothetical protein [Chloroflexaceae bacterium]